MDLFSFVSGALCTLAALWIAKQLSRKDLGKQHSGNSNLIPSGVQMKRPVQRKKPIVIDDQKAWEIEQKG